MSEPSNPISEAPEAKKRVPPEVTKVTMDDGRTVEFVGKRQLDKEILLSENGVEVRFNFRNGQSRTISLTAESPLLWNFAGHGASQKIGDETAGEKDVEDMVVAVDNILERLNSGKWLADRASGDGFSGASVVIRAIMEATGKDLTFVKSFLERKLAESKAQAEASGGKALTRQALYASFRAPGTKTASIIARMEAEKLAKASAVDADELLGEM